MKLKAWLQETYTEAEGQKSFFNEPFLETRPKITCKDGFTMSVQASVFHYCNPRHSLKDGNYDSIEIGFPSDEEDLIMEYCENQSNPTNTVYGFVPIEIVEQVIIKHGGIK